jgi:hypothetical protein
MVKTRRNYKRKGGLNYGGKQNRKKNAKTAKTQLDNEQLGGAVVQKLKLNDGYSISVTLDSDGNVKGLSVKTPNGGEVDINGRMGTASDGGFAGRWIPADKSGQDMLITNESDVKIINKDEFINEYGDIFKIIEAENSSWGLSMPKLSAPSLSMPKLSAPSLSSIKNIKPPNLQKSFTKRTGQASELFNRTKKNVGEMSKTAMGQISSATASAASSASNVARSVADKARKLQNPIELNVQLKVKPLFTSEEIRSTTDELIDIKKEKNVSGASFKSGVHSILEKLRGLSSRFSSAVNKKNTAIDLKEFGVQPAEQTMESQEKLKTDLREIVKMQENVYDFLTVVVSNQLLKSDSEEDHKTKREKVLSGMNALSSTVSGLYTAYERFKEAHNVDINNFCAENGVIIDCKGENLMENLVANITQYIDNVVDEDFTAKSTDDSVELLNDNITKMVPLVSTLIETYLNFANKTSSFTDLDTYLNINPTQAESGESAFRTVEPQENVAAQEEAQEAQEAQEEAQEAQEAQEEEAQEESGESSFREVE